MLGLKPSRVFSTVVFATVLAATSPALAADAAVEKQAKSLQKKAMEENYLATEYAKAKDQLEKAITLCGAAACAPAVKAPILRDLATVQLIGLNEKAKATASMTEAVRLDPKLALNSDYETKELRALYDAAKKGAATPEPAPTGPAPTGPAPTGPAPSSGGDDEADFDLMSVPEQVVRTPLPIAVSYEGDVKIVKVIAHYKGFGMTSFKNLELKKLADGKSWGANVACLDVVQGDFAYYVSGYDAANDEVATAGTKKDPLHSAVKPAIEGTAPHLPGAAPEAQCAEASDCPVGLPGCKGGGTTIGDPTSLTSSGKEIGASCGADSDCGSNRCGTNEAGEGVCVAGDPPTDMDGVPRLWVGITGGVNLSFVPSASQVCSLDPTTAAPINGGKYYCMNGSSDFPSRADASENASIDPNQKSNSVSGGIAANNFPVLATIDYAVNKNLLVGARLGYVFGGYNGNAAKHFPVHVEARLTYLLGKDALSKGGLSPYISGGAGASTFSPSVAVVVKMNDQTKRDVKAFYEAGPVFVNAGAGVRYAVSPSVAFTGGARLNAAFVNAFLLSVTPEVGIQMGF